MHRQIVNGGPIRTPWNLAAYTVIILSRWKFHRRCAMCVSHVVLLDRSEKASLRLGLSELSANASVNLYAKLLKPGCLETG